MDQPYRNFKDALYIFLCIKQLALQLQFMVCDTFTVTNGNKYCI